MSENKFYKELCEEVGLEFAIYDFLPFNVPKDIKQLRGRFTLEPVFDIKDLSGISIENELKNMMKLELNHAKKEGYTKFYITPTMHDPKTGEPCKIFYVGK